MRRLFLLSVFLAFTFAGGAWASDIYVRLSDRPSVAITSDTAMTLTDAANKRHNLGKSATLARSGAYATVGRQRFRLPVKITTSGLLGFNNRRYRGEFLFNNRYLINIVNIEDYVQGVVPAEGVPTWPKEYQKVQAIISRTYGLRQRANRPSRGYDVVDTTSDQVYKGAGVETQATNQAVRETAGEVLTYRDELAFTFFHSDSGGYTATNAHVWGRDVPYLIGVREPVAYQSPHSTWTARISAAQVQAALTKMGINVGRVREVRVAEVDAGGRARTLTFVGSSGTASARSSNFRTHIGPNLLKSTFLTSGAPAPPPQTPLPAPPPQVSPQPSPPSPAVPQVPTSNIPMTGEQETLMSRMTSDGIFTAAELIDMLMNPDKRRGYLYIGMQRSGGNLPNRPRTPLPQPTPPAAMPPLSRTEVIKEENGFFVFRGRGWGHGVGLSQWGAMAMAREGWTAKRILEHYYPGTTVKRFR